MRYLTLLLLIVLSAPARATDVAAVVAALKDEASECRYYQQLCDKFRDVHRQLVVSNGLADRARQDYEAGRISRDDYSLIVKSGAPLIPPYERAESDARTARDMIRAKHAKPPKCAAACDDILK